MQRIFSKTSSQKLFSTLYGLVCFVSLLVLGYLYINNHLNVNAATSLPAGFTDTTIASGLDQPTAMKFATDGRLFVSEKAGRLRVIKNNTLLPTPFVTLPVDNYSERGLLGIAFDPNYNSNKYIYLYYTKSGSPSVNRVSRFSASLTNPDQVEVGSELVILDNIPSDAGNHNGGAIHFGSDGKLYVAVGDGGATNTKAQSLDNFSGKLLRINSDGTVPADNPFVGQVGQRGEIWAYGLRNPFTFTENKDNGQIWVNDVGQETWEEVNVIQKGGNYGWPTCEGACTNPNFINPLYTYNHSVGFSITGSAFYKGTQFPQSYDGVYFFGDFVNNWIRMIDPKDGNRVSDFATNASSPVDIQVGSDGSVYYLSYLDGFVNKISYSLEEKYLSDLNYTVIANGYDSVQKDTAVGVKDQYPKPSLTLNGVVYQKGLGVHAISEINYNLAGKCNRFSSDVGVDDYVGSNGTVTFQVFAGGLKLFDSGAMTGDTATKQVNVDLRGKDELKLVVLDNGDNDWFDDANWADAKLLCLPEVQQTPQPPTASFLSDLNYSTVRNGWGPTEKDKSNGEQAAGDGRTIKLNNVTYAKGLGVHAASEVSYNLAGKCTNFSSDIGVDDEVAQGSIIFQVYTDNVKIYDSGLMLGTSATKSISLDVTGKSSLRLVVTDGGNGNGQDHGDWANAKLSCGGIGGPSSTPTPIPTQPVNQTWTNQDIGSVPVAGSTTESNGVVTIKGAGDIWGVNDTFQYNYKSLTGDGEMIARVVSQDISGEYPKAGLMIRSALSTNATYGYIFSTPTKGTYFHYNPTLAGNTASITGPTVNTPQWLKIKRDGTIISGFTSSDGINWNQVSSASPEIGVNAFIGLAVTSNSSNLSQAVFDNVQIVGENNLPNPVINTPAVSSTYNAGDPISFSGTAFDSEDGDLPLSAYSWSVELHHDTHAHPFIGPITNVNAGSFQIPQTGETSADTWYRITLTVMDSKGSKKSVTRDINPNKSNITLATNPIGLQITLDGQPQTTPFSFQSVVGFTRTLGAPTIQNLNGRTYQFYSWANGGAQTQSITTPVDNTTYTASYIDITPAATPTPTAVPTIAPTPVPTAEPTPVPTTPPLGAQTKYLSDLAYTVITNGWGPVEKDQSNGEQALNDGRIIKLNNVTYAKGLGVHAASEVRYNMAGKCTNFSASIGVDDEVSQGSVIFQVYADNQKVYDSSKMIGTTATKNISVSVSGKNTLRLLVTDSGDNNGQDHGDWANARITCN